MSNKQLTTSGHSFILFRAVDLRFEGAHILLGVLVKLAES